MMEEVESTARGAARAEEFMRECGDLDWVVVRPPRLLDCPRRGKHRTAVDFLPPKGIEIGRADLAAFMLEQLASDEHLRAFVTVAY